MAAGRRAVGRDGPPHPGVASEKSAQSLSPPAATIGLSGPLPKTASRRLLTLPCRRAWRFCVASRLVMLLHNGDTASATTAAIIHLSFAVIEVRHSQR